MASPHTVGRHAADQPSREVHRVPPAVDVGSGGILIGAGMLDLAVDRDQLRSTFSN